MLARLIHSPFARCSGLFLLVLALVAVVFSPTTGWAQAQGTGAGLGIRSPEVLADGNQPMSGSQRALNVSASSGPRGARELDVGYQPFLSPLVIPAADFRNDGNGPNAYFFDFSNGYVRSQGGVVYLMAPAYLPHHATVTRMNVSLYDNGGAARPWLQLYRVNKSTGIVDMMAAVATPSTGTSIQDLADSTITNPLVDFPNYAYYIGAGLFHSSQRIYSVRLYYTGP